MLVAETFPSIVIKPGKEPSVNNGGKLPTQEQLALMDITIVFSLILLLLSFLFILFKPSTPKNLPPGPRPWPIVGNVLQLGFKPHARLAEMARGHGPLISLKVGSTRMVVASSPAAAREVLKVHDRSLSGRFIPLAMHVKGFTEFSMVWSTEPGKYWKAARRILQAELLAPKLVEAQAHLRELKVGEMVDFLRGRQGKAVRIRDVVHQTLFGVVVHLVFSSEVAKDEMEGLLRRAVDLTGVTYPSLWLSAHAGHRRLVGAAKKIDEEVVPYIFGRRSSVNGERAVVVVGLRMITSAYCSTLGSVTHRSMRCLW